MQGFLDVQSLEMKPFSSAGNVQSITVSYILIVATAIPNRTPTYVGLVINYHTLAQIKGKKASWTAGSSFPLKKATSMVPKIKIDDESDLIDEDSLLTEEDRKKPQLPACMIQNFKSFLSCLLCDPCKLTVHLLWLSWRL